VLVRWCGARTPLTPRHSSFVPVCRDTHETMQQQPHVSLVLSNSLGRLLSCCCVTAGHGLCLERYMPLCFTTAQTDMHSLLDLQEPPVLTCVTFQHSCTEASTPSCPTRAYKYRSRHMSARTCLLLVLPPPLQGHNWKQQSTQLQGNSRHAHCGAGSCWPPKHTQCPTVCKQPHPQLSRNALHQADRVLHQSSEQTPLLYTSTTTPLAPPPNTRAPKRPLTPATNQPSIGCNPRHV
jgi:hypothetical protein